MFSCPRVVSCNDWTPTINEVSRAQIYRVLCSTKGSKVESSTILSSSASPLARRLSSSRH